MRILASRVVLGLSFALLSHTGFGLLGTGWVSPAQAQAIPKSIEAAGPDAEIKNRKNNWTVGVAGGQMSGSYMTFADELGQVLDQGDELRIIPMVTYGAASNMDDLLYLRGVDIAVTQSDVFEYFRTQRKTPNLDTRVNYIIRLPVSELHILARKEIRSIEDLRGKKVSFGPQGAGSSLTGSIVFQRLGIKAEQLFLDNPSAMQKLASGEISAVMRQVGKPIDVFAKMPKDSPYHFVPIPFSKTFADYYTIGEFNSKDYPGLVPEAPRSIRLRFPQCSPCSTGRRGTTATAASRVWSSRCSPTGRSSGSRRVIRSGATSIWQRRFRVGHVGALLKRCCGSCSRTAVRIRRWRAAISRPSCARQALSTRT